MMVRLLSHSILLISAVILTFFWTRNHELATYSLQLVGLIIICYFGTKLFFRREATVMALDATIITITILLIVDSTGGISSTTFFLLYFLLFAQSLLFEPFQAVVTSLALVGFFIAGNEGTFDQPTIINLVTLLSITPLALIFGRKYLESSEAAGKIKILNHIIATEETDTLIWLSTKAKPTIANILDTTSQIIGSNLLPFRLQERLKQLHLDLITLHQSATILESDLDGQEKP